MEGASGVELWVKGGGLEGTINPLDFVSVSEECGQPFPSKEGCSVVEFHLLSFTHSSIKGSVPWKP